jgi:hypothetical protein
MASSRRRVPAAGEAAAGLAARYAVGRACVDRAEQSGVEAAQAELAKGQVGFINRLVQLLKGGTSDSFARDPTGTEHRGVANSHGHHGSWGLGL